jgi:NAD kinase
MALQIKQETILAITRDLRARALKGTISKDMMVCVHQSVGGEPKVMVSKYDGRHKGVLTTNKDGSVEAMVSVVKINEQLAAKIKRKEDKLKDRHKSVTTLCLDGGDGVTRHGRIELKPGGVEALSFSTDSFGGTSISYDDLLTMNLQNKVNVIGSSKATSFLRLAFNRNKESPELNAAELFEQIRNEFGIKPPEVETPESTVSFRR